MDLELGMACYHFTPSEDSFEARRRFRFGAAVLATRAISF